MEPVFATLLLTTIAMDQMAMVHHDHNLRLSEESTSSDAERSKLAAQRPAQPAEAAETQ